RRHTRSTRDWSSDVCSFDLTGAFEKITEHEEIKMNNISSIYETDPVGYTDQADFLNMIIEVETTLSPMDLLAYCQGIENRLGRRSEERRVGEAGRDR